MSFNEAKLKQCQLVLLEHLSSLFLLVIKPVTCKTQNLALI